MADRLEVNLEGVDLNVDSGGFIIVCAVVGEVSIEAPVILLCRFLEEGVVLSRGPDDKVAEPGEELLDWLLMVDNGFGV